MRSSNGCDWSGPEVLLSVPDYLVSPSVVKVGNNWQLWSVQTTGWGSNSSVVERRTSVNGRDWQNPEPVTIFQPGKVIWHLDVKYIPAFNEYWMIFCAYDEGSSCSTSEELYADPPADQICTVTNMYLYFAKSKDGLNWQTFQEPILKTSQSGWDNNILYRSTFLYDEARNYIRVWYSAANEDRVWHIGYTERDLDEFFGELGEPLVMSNSPLATFPNSGRHFRISPDPYTIPLVHKFLVYESDNGVYLTYASPSEWSAPVRVDDGSYPSVMVWRSATPDGGFYAVSYVLGIYPYIRFFTSSDWTPRFPLWETPPPEVSATGPVSGIMGARHPSGGLSYPNAGVVFQWNSAGTANLDFIYIYYDGSIHWIEAECIRSCSNPDGEIYLFQPCIAMTPATPYDIYHVVWQEGGYIWYNMRNPQGNWFSSPIQVPNSQDGSHPFIEASGDSVYISWSCLRNSSPINHDIFRISRHIGTGQWGALLDISNTPSGRQDSDWGVLSGRSFVVWSEEPSVNWEVEYWAQLDPWAPPSRGNLSGTPIPSPYCLKRDGFVEGVADYGDTLVYQLPYLYPSRYYLLRAILFSSGPDTGYEVSVSFEGIKDTIITLQPGIPDTLYTFLPKLSYDDTKAHIIITSLTQNDAYLSDLTLYQFDVVEGYGEYARRGVKEFESKNPNFTTSLEVHPNPIKKMAEVRYEISDKSPVSLRVYDATGRLIKTLVRVQSQEPGVYRVSWDRADNNGKKLPNGIYFLRLNTENHPLTEKIILLK